MPFAAIFNLPHNSYGCLRLHRDSLNTIGGSYDQHLAWRISNGHIRNCAILSIKGYYCTISIYCGQNTATNHDEEAACTEYGNLYILF